MRKFLKKKIWSHGTPLGSLGSLSQVQIVECFQNSIGLVLWGLYVTPIPFSAMADIKALRGASGVMCNIYLLTYMRVFGLDFVIKLLRDGVAQTHVILNPYY